MQLCMARRWRDRGGVAALRGEVVAAREPLVGGGGGGLPGLELRERAHCHLAWALPALLPLWRLPILRRTGRHATTSDATVSELLVAQVLLKLTPHARPVRQPPTYGLGAQRGALHHPIVHRGWRSRMRSVHGRTMAIRADVHSHELVALGVRLCAGIGMLLLLRSVLVLR